MVWPLCLNFRLITANNSSVQKIRNFTVVVPALRYVAGLVAVSDVHLLDTHLFFFCLPKYSFKEGESDLGQSYMLLCTRGWGIAGILTFLLAKHGYMLSTAGHSYDQSSAKSFTQMSLVLRKRSLGFPTRSDTNRAVQLQKMARGLKFRI